MGPSGRVAAQSVRRHHVLQGKQGARPGERADMRECQQAAEQSSDHVIKQGASLGARFSQLRHFLCLLSRSLWRLFRRFVTRTLGWRQTVDPESTFAEQQGASCDFAQLPAELWLRTCRFPSASTPSSKNAACFFLLFSCLFLPQQMPLAISDPASVGTFFDILSTLIPST